MRIKRLEVIGFKSFCDRTVLTFDQPITGVVGPNGCGKSNIVDAIRWCMGEQSAKHLRGKAMDDVIFAGSESRGPLGMCEVTLVFENDGRVPIEYLAYSEIAVTRRLHRDGTSEYFLNKTPCRLRDITDFFLGTGIGAKAYSIIEQGRVGMIVSSKAEDRRFLIEEAAGITKYKVKKKAAEKKMEATRQNLLRVSDVLAEIEKQLASLRRQAQKAERYKQYKAELRDIDLWSASQRYLGHLAEGRVLDETLAEVSGAREAAHAEVTTREASLETARLALAEEEERLSALQSALYELDNRIRLGESEADHEEKASAQLLARADEAEAETALIDARAAEDAEAAASAEAELSALEAASAGQDDRLTDEEDALRRAKEEQQVLGRRLDTTRGELGEHKAAIARDESGQEALRRRGDDLATRLSRLDEEGSRLSGRKEELATLMAELEQKLGGLKQLRLDLGVEKERAEARVDELKALLAESGATLDALTHDLHQRRSRHRSLVEIQERYEGFARGTRAVMHEKESRWGIVGLVPDLLVVPAEHEAAVEAVLAERIGAIVVESQEVGVDAVELLKQKSEGRATFVPLNRFVATPAAPGARSLPEGDGVRGWLIDQVGCDEAHRGLVEHLLGGVVLVDDLLSALDLWRARPAEARLAFVTPAGELVDKDGLVTGGSREAAAAGVMQQKREIRELEALLGDLEARHAELLASHTGNKNELNALTKTLEALRKDAHQGEVDYLTHDKDLHRLKDELERLGARTGQVSRDREDLAREADEAAREAEEVRLRLRERRDALVACEDRLSELGHEQVALVERVEAQNDVVTTLRVAAAQVREKRQALTAALERLASEARARAERKERLGRQMVEQREEARALEATSQARRAELIGLAEEHGRRAEELAVERRAYDDRRAGLAEVELGLRALRHELEALGQRQNQLELRRHDVLAARQHLEETIAERYRVDVRDHLVDYHLRPPVNGETERRQKELRDLIERMGEINLHAIEEYNELEARYTFLTGQKTDLEQALAQLEEAIARINATSKQRFREVFDLVNAKFQEIFPRCFRGGHARLVLTDEENLLESGIEIVAQPPGKKNATVEVLSGGEKAMTAVALIFAIFLIKPSPFCLLDEVDAPLDEANVGRFNDLIREMTDRSQFILITHNKRTMQIADTLYGVTMENPGISKLVSVNLSQIGKGARIAPAAERASA
jgi:chromosome segregation protein